MYKLIAIDMDGTLLNDNHEISEQSIRALEKAKKENAIIAICTGRPANGVRQYEALWRGLIDYTISYNGGFIEDMSTRQALHQCFLEKEAIEYLYDISLELQVPMHFHGGDNLYTPNKKISKYTVIDAYLSESNLQYIDMQDLPQKAQYPKAQFIDEPDKLSHVINQLPEKVHEQFTIVQSEPYFLEFMHKETNKGIAVKTLADHLQINREDIIAFGNNENDISMLEYAGCAVAMENATQSVKNIADKETGSNNKHGVAETIQKIYQ